jgi:hypothetical protein
VRSWCDDAPRRQAEKEPSAHLRRRRTRACASRSATDVSGFSVYIGNRIVLMLRENVKSPRDNGVWLVLSDGTDPEDPKLKREFPSLRRIELLGNKIGHWLVIPSDGPNFESEALHACDLLLRHDPRIGRVPVSRR